MQEALKFFENKYNIAPQKEYKPYLQRKLQNPKPEVEEYLRTRGIDPEKVRNKIEYGMHSIARL
jgi:predicted house-cleaning noncanonical NTP pyrophosphatase (MazG superfamily)